MQCPFCKETIQDGAIKCRHCGSMLNAAPQTPQQQFQPQQNMQPLDEGSLKYKMLSAIPWIAGIGVALFVVWFMSLLN